jgi:hypothetical protein
MRSIEFMHFNSFPAHLHRKDFLAGCLPGSPLGFPMVFLCFSLGFIHFLMERYVSRGVLSVAACCRLAMRSIECMHFHSVPAYLHHKDFLAGCLPGSPLGFSYGFPMLFLRFYSLPGGKIREPRCAVWRRLAMRSIECMHF